MCEFPQTAPRLTTHKPKPTRQGTTARGYGHHWQRVRKIKLRAAPLCEMNLDGCTGWGEAVHHRDKDTTNNAPGNLQSVCAHCHNLHHLRERKHDH